MNFINILLIICYFLSIFLYYLKMPVTITFFMACLGIIPLAGLMGKATEELAKKRGPVIGGLLNATFGNATELIIAFVALREGYYEVVKASITGSIIGNLLLVLGVSIFAGGLKYKTQKFNKAAVSNSSTLMTIALIGLLVPAVFSHVTKFTEGSVVVEDLSLCVAVLLLIVYFAGLVFSLHTHKSLFSPVSENCGGDTCEEEHCKPAWSTGKSMTVLLVSTVLVVFASEILVKSIEGVMHQLHLSQLFVGVIIIAIIGNAAEHGMAVIMAIKNKTDLAISIVTNSSTQIALFVAPVLVLAGFFIGKHMSLLFNPFEVLAVGLSIVIATMIASDGESNWFEGVLLLAVYLILAVGFYFLK